MIGQFKFVSPPVLLLTVLQLCQLISLKIGKESLLYLYCTCLLRIRVIRLGQDPNATRTLYFYQMGGGSVQERVSQMVIGGIRERCSVLHLHQVFFVLSESIRLEMQTRYNTQKHA